MCIATFFKTYSCCAWNKVPATIISKKNCPFHGISELRILKCNLKIKNKGIFFSYHLKISPMPLPYGHMSIVATRLWQQYSCIWTLEADNSPRRIQSHDGYILQVLVYISKKSVYIINPSTGRLLSSRANWWRPMVVLIVIYKWNIPSSERIFHNERKILQQIYCECYISGDRYLHDYQMDTRRPNADFYFNIIFLFFPVTFCSP